MDIRAIEQDTQAEEEGQWIELPGFPGVSAKVRGMGYKPYRRKRDRVTAKHARKFRPGKFDSVLYEELTRPILLEELLVDVRGLTNGDGGPVSVDKVRQLAQQDSAYRFYKAIEAACSEVGELDEDELETDVGNSETPSATD